MVENPFDVKMYQRKLEFISRNAKRIDHDWFRPEGYLVWVNSILYADDGSFKVGFYAMNRAGKFCFVFDGGYKDEQPNWDPNSDQEPKIKKFKNYDPLDIDWLFMNVSVNSMLWQVNKIYDELK